MSSASIYILDANVFIEAARRYYALDIAPGFWEALIAMANNGRIISIDKVKDELDRGNDALKDWANEIFYQWFISTDQGDVTVAYRRVMEWARSQTHYTGTAQAEFASSTDGWLIAYALAKGNIVVTHEVYNATIRKKIKIPNVCEGIGVQYTDTFRMMRDLKVQLKAGPPAPSR
jgi:hypothetical protein